MRKGEKNKESYLKKKLALVLICFFCVIFIFFNSSQTGDASNTRSKKIVNEIVTVIKESYFNNSLDKKYSYQEINLTIRKFAHGFEFCLLSIGIYLLLNSFDIKGKRTVVYTLFLVLICAVLDEMFQLNIPGRNSSRIDVLIDFVGGSIGTYLIIKVRSSFGFK